MIVLFLLILPVIKCYMNLLEPFNSFISSLRALYLWFCSYLLFLRRCDRMFSVLPPMSLLPNFIFHISTFLSRYKLSCFNLCCVAPSCPTPLYVSTLQYIFLLVTVICFWVLPNLVSPPGCHGPSASSHRAVPLVILMASDPFPEVHQWLPCVWYTRKCAQYFQHGLTGADSKGSNPFAQSSDCFRPKMLLAIFAARMHCWLTLTHCLSRYLHITFSQASTSHQPQLVPLFLLYMARILPLTLSNFIRFLSALFLIVESWLTPSGWQSSIYNFINWLPSHGLIILKLGSTSCSRYKRTVLWRFWRTLLF